MLKLLLSLVFTFIVLLVSTKAFGESFSYVEAVTLVLAYYIFFSQKD